MANNTKAQAMGIGKVKVKALINGQWERITIHDVEYVPGGNNLFSENVALKKVLEVRENGNDDIVYYGDGKLDI